MDKCRGHSSKCLSLPVDRSVCTVINTRSARLCEYGELVCLGPLDGGLEVDCVVQVGSVALHVADVHLFNGDTLNEHLIT